MMNRKHKQTELGLIPSDWEVAQLGQIAKIRMCKRIFADQTTEKGDIPFYKIGTFGGKPDAFISRRLYEEYKAKYSYPQKGDILVSAAGTLGRTVIYDGKDAYFQDSNIVWLDIDKEKICNEYLEHYYKIIKWASSEGSTISRLYNGIIESTYIAYPQTIAEQKRIAEALSDIDKLISSLEKLIDKKKAIKQGAMEQLLTGKTRLPGFSTQWEEKNLEEYIYCIRGVSFDGTKDVFESESENTIRLLRSNNIHDGLFVDDEILYINKERASEIQQIRSDDLMICMANGSKTLIGKNCLFSIISPGKYTFGTFMSCLRKKTDNVNMKYIYYILNSSQYWKDISILLSGSSINNLRPKDILNMSFMFPDSNEQNAIVEILSSMDCELLALKEKLSKYISINQGIRQQLLTGKNKLV